MSRLWELRQELADALMAKNEVERRRDEMTREANKLMIDHHNVMEKISRITVDIVSLPEEG